MVADRPVNRRSILLWAGSTLPAALAGCLSAGGGAGRSPRPGTDGPDCESPEGPLVDLLAPAPEDLDRTDPRQASEAFLDENRATAAVAADYRDGDGEVLDDATVRLFRFREGADGEAVLTDHLTDAEFDSGRVGAGALLGRVGFLAVAPTRERARTLLLGSPALSRDCFEANAVGPSATRTPDGATTRTTEEADARDGEGPRHTA